VETRKPQKTGRILKIHKSKNKQKKNKFMQPVIQQNQKRFGTPTFIDNKVRVHYSDGVESVLFEDISSISYKSINTPNPLMGLIGGLLGGLFLMLPIFTDMNFALSFLLGIATIIGSLFLLRIKFDNVIVETRGGKLLIYSVEFGRGKEQMENIESEKRKHS
jgi:hypothetical protein